MLKKKNNKNKVDVQFPFILVWKLHTQACEIVRSFKSIYAKLEKIDLRMHS